MGVLQGSPLSPILFLYYNASLLELCNQPKRGLSGIGFADDINLLIYSPSTEANCRKLKRVHKELLTWARHHGMKFAPKKYELIHFTQCRKFNLRAGIRLEGEAKTPSPDIRILGVWVDTKLQWSAQLKEAKEKVVSQIGALVKTTASI